MALSRKEDQCLFLAVLIALKYPAFEVLATSRVLGVSCLLATLVALLNLRQRMVRYGVHQGLVLWDSLDAGVCSFRRAMSLSSDSDSHSSSLHGVGYVRAGGPCHPIFQAFFFFFLFFLVIMRSLFLGTKSLMQS